MTGEQEQDLVPIVTCEHGGNLVPEEYRGLFVGWEEVLAGHRGWDEGAEGLAREVGGRLGAPVFAGSVTRLVVELNRSRESGELFSEVTRGLPEEEKGRILEQYWFPYRNAVETAVAGAVDGGGVVLHLSVHSFSQEWEGRRREVDVGVLFDPERRGEVAFWERFRSELTARRPRLAVRANEPYLGTADGFTSYLRTRFGGDVYLGVELEVGLGLVRGEGWDAVRGDLVEAVVAAVEGR